MAPTKRARPSFSPPRPGKAKSSKAGSSILKKQKAPSTRNISHKRKTSRQDDLDQEDRDVSEDDEEEETRPTTKAKAKSKKSARPFIMDEASDSDPDPEDDDDEDEDLEPEDEPEASTFLSRPSDSPEPDMILAEIEVSQPTRSPIPEALVHKMLTHHFTKKDVKMSRDARDLVTKYIEVFVREAIMRSAYERQEKEKDGGGGGAGGGGFLEVEDLERAAVQLCLDF